jgi:predicted nucleic acid-binding protein
VKLRIYLDTSVISALHDSRDTVRQQETVEFWKRLGEFEVAVSELTQQELAQVADPGLRDSFRADLQGVSLHYITDEMRDLARRYAVAGVFTPAMFNDGLHVAAAVLTRQDVLVSWNFRHLVNRRRRAQVNQVNILAGLPPIDIAAPPEM